MPLRAVGGNAARVLAAVALLATASAFMPVSPLRRSVSTALPAAAVPFADRAELTTSPESDKISAENPLRVVIAGAGVGGLALANALADSPTVSCTVLERTSEFRRFGGPIQLASNAMQVMKDMDPAMFKDIEAKATFTGNLTNGIKDGIRDEWYAMFDLKTPAAMREMPYTCVVERPDLQQILLDRLAPGVVNNGAAVKHYVQENGALKITMENGDLLQADVLVGADGIWSSVRSTMHENEPKGEGSGATYSGYTVYAGELDYVAPDNGEVGYKVYIGPSQYFVITDIGNGRYQWYAFLAKPVGSAELDEKPTEALEGCAAGNPAYLRGVFEGWSDDIHAILRATRDDEIEQRDLYDRPPAVRKPWTDGRVALLGDAIHAMMPNLGQGGCQAIEDAMVLAEELQGLPTRDHTVVSAALTTYKDRRLVRSAAVQGLSRFASDIIIRGFDTPAKVVGGKFENFNYAGIVTRLLQPVLPIFFQVQFSFLYDGWKNKAGLQNVGSGLAILAFGLVFLAAFAVVAGDAGLLATLGLEGLLGAGDAGGLLEAINGLLPEFDSFL